MTGNSPNFMETINPQIQETKKKICHSKHEENYPAASQTNSSNSVAEKSLLYWGVKVKGNRSLHTSSNVIMQVKRYLRSLEVKRIGRKMYT